MIKKTTLVLVLCAAVLGGAVYYFDWRHDSEKKPAADSSKPAFSIQAADIASLTLSHPGQPGDAPIRMEKREGLWRIVQPIETDADQSTADGIVDQLAGARIAQTEPGSPDRRKAFGLDAPQTSLEFQSRSGAKHTLLFGDKDFSGDLVYTIVDGGQDVALLPQLLSTSAAKSLDDLRDRAVLHVDSEQIASFELKNSAGNLVVSKDKDEWKFAAPAGALAGKDAVDLLLQAIANAKMVSVADEKLDNLARYGLATPAVTLSVSDNKGKKATLAVGKKDGAAYFARDLSRPTIFRIDDDVYKKVSEKFDDLRDKQVLHASLADIQRVQIQDAGGSIAFSRAPGNSEEWTFETPTDRKGKPVSSWKILDPIGNLQADEVIDHPAPNLLAQVSNPAVRLILTGKDGKDLTLRLSKPSGDYVYAQASGNAALFKLKKQTFDELNVNAADLAAGDAAPD
jgi:Domain of unknown function (DUF4340)